MNSFKILPLLLVFLGLIPGCCPDIDPYFMPTEMDVKAIWNNSLYDDLGGLNIEIADGFELWIEFSKKEFMANASSSFSFSNSLMAMQPCPEDGHAGLKSPVNSITITSSEEFQGVPAGGSINAYFHRLEPAGADEEGNQTFIQSTIDSELARFHFLSYYETHLAVLLSELPGNTLGHEFTITLTFENGTSISGVSSEVQF